MFKKIKKICLGLLIIIAMPWPVLAFSANTFADLVKGLISSVIYPLGAILVSLAVIYFIWNAIQFIRAEDKKRDEARQAMIYGLIGLTVMVSFWGIIAILQNTAKLDNGTSVSNKLNGVLGGTVSGGSRSSNDTFGTDSGGTTNTQDGFFTRLYRNNVESTIVTPTVDWMNRITNTKN